MSTTEYRWVWQDHPEPGWNAVTNFWPDVVAPDGSIVGLRLNPNGPMSTFELALRRGYEALGFVGPLAMSNFSPYFVDGYEYTPNLAERKASMPLGVDMMPTQAFEVGFFIAGGRLGRLNRAGAGSATEGTTTLYRSVGNAEFEQIIRTGTFEAGPNSLGGKWFAETIGDAAEWGQRLEGKNGFRIVDARIPTIEAAKFLRNPFLDGIGPARYGELNQLRNATIGVVK